MEEKREKKKHSVWSTLICALWLVGLFVGIGLLVSLQVLPNALLMWIVVGVIITEIVFIEDGDDEAHGYWDHKMWSIFIGFPLASLIVAPIALAIDRYTETSTALAALGSWMAMHLEALTWVSIAIAGIVAFFLVNYVIYTKRVKPREELKKKVKAEGQDD